MTVEKRCQLFMMSAETFLRTFTIQQLSFYILNTSGHNGSLDLAQ